MAGKVINLDTLRRGAPRRGGYLVLNQRTIATFYAMLHPHSKELYLFRLLDDEKRRPISLMDGNLPIIGTVGQGLRLEGFNIHVLCNDTGKKLKYDGHVQDIGWVGERDAGTPCGTAGQAKRLEAVKFWLS